MNYKYSTAEDFLTDHERTLLREKDPMKRHPITLGFVRLMELREESLCLDAVSSELDRLYGFIRNVDLCESDKDIMLTWIRNSRAALSASDGRDLMG